MMSQLCFRRTATLAMAGIAAVSALSACTHGGQPRAGGAPASRPSPAAPQATPSAAPSPAPVTTSQPAATTPPPLAQPVAAVGPAACTPGDLRVSVGSGDGTAGSIYYPVLFTNVSPVTCTMYGYPGVALVTGPGGRVVGAPAVRNPTFPKEVVPLAPGAVAHASLQVVIAGNYPAARCKPATAHWLQVYPPGQYAARYVAFTAQTCTARVGDGSTLGIYVVRPGATGP